MLTKILSSIGLLLMTQVAAAGVGDVRCMSWPATTTYMLEQDQEGYLLSGYHHNGTDYMPIHQGLVTIADIKTLDERARILSQIGDRFQIRFSNEQCKLTNGDVYCAKNQVMTIGNLEVRSVGFSVGQRRVITSLVDYSTHQVYFSVTVGNIGYTMPMEYEKGHCVFQ